MHMYMAVADRSLNVGSCVMTVIMLYQFRQRELPGLGPSLRPHVDIASFEDLWFSVNEVIYSCMSPAPMLGWHEDGERLAENAKAKSRC